jgi:hypothetical protein
MDENELRERLEKARSGLKQQVKALFSKSDWERKQHRRSGPLLAYALIHIEVLIELYEEYEEQFQRGQAYSALAKLVEFKVPELKDYRQVNLRRILAAFDEFDQMLADSSV